MGIHATESGIEMITVKLLHPVVLQVRKATFSQYSLSVRNRVVYLASRNRCLELLKVVAKVLELLEIEATIQVERTS